MAKRRTPTESRKFVLDALKYSNPKVHSTSKTETFNTLSPWSKNNRDERTLAIDFCLLGSANSELKIQINNDFLKHLDQTTAGIIVKSLILYNSELMKLAAFLQQDEIFEKVIPHLLFSPTDFSQAKEMRKITDFMLKYFKPENLKKVLVKQFPEGSNLTPKFVHLAVYKIHASSPKMVDEAMLSNIIRRAKFDPRKGISWLAQSWRSLVNWYCSRREMPNVYHKTISLKNHMDDRETRGLGSATPTSRATRGPRVNMTPPPIKTNEKAPSRPEPLALQQESITAGNQSNPNTPPNTPPNHSSSPSQDSANTEQHHPALSPIPQLLATENAATPQDKSPTRTLPLTLKALKQHDAQTKYNTSPTHSIAAQLFSTSSSEVSPAAPSSQSSQVSSYEPSEASSVVSEYREETAESGASSDVSSMVSSETNSSDNSQDFTNFFNKKEATEPGGTTALNI